jgi:uncharacterized protein YcfJ
LGSETVLLQLDIAVFSSVTVKFSAFIMVTLKTQEPVMKMFQHKLFAAVLVSALSGTAFAEQQHEVILESPQTVEKIVYARVVRVSPVFHYVSNTRPVKECWEEPVSRQRYYRGNSGSSTLAGGLLGGIIGHQIGHGHNRPISTALGTIIGAQIGHDSGTRGTYTTHETYRNVCRVTEQEDGFEAVQDGYEVSYLFEGKKYNTHLPYDPGSRIKLKVQVDTQ